MFFDLATSVFGGDAVDGHAGDLEPSHDFVKGTSKRKGRRIRA